MKALNTTKNTELASSLEMASSLTSRVIGLMGRKKFPQGSGLWIKRSGNSIHTCFMNFAIDLVFIDKSGSVRFLKKDVNPWKFVFAPLFTRTDCLELPAGMIEQSKTQIGDTIHVEA